MARDARKSRSTRSNWGGRRPGAGRKPGPNGPGVSHKERPAVAARHPLMITFRVKSELGSALRPPLLRAIREAIEAGRDSHGGRICALRVESDRIHLLVEAANRDVLGAVMHALGIRVARGMNRALGRTGKVFADRYEARVLKTAADAEETLRQLFVNHDAATPVMAPRTAILQEAERAVGLDASRG